MFWPFSARETNSVRVCACAHPNVAAADEKQRQQVSQQQNRHLVGALGCSGPLLPTEGAVGGARMADEYLVLGHRH